jgi:histidinol phosphatase-like PHP family hydrolase
VTDATIKAIEKHHEKIRFIGHPCNNADFGEYYDIERLVEIANAYKIPLEVNAKNLMYGKTNIPKLRILLEKAHRLYLNSDAHTLYELQEARPFALQFLKDNNYIS